MHIILQTLKFYVDSNSLTLQESMKLSIVIFKMGTIIYLSENGDQKHVFLSVQAK